MNREEAIAHGMEVHETKHSMKRRCPWHDYHKKGTWEYHMEKKTITRAQCLELNAMAERIASNG